MFEHVALRIKSIDVHNYSYENKCKAVSTQLYTFPCTHVKHTNVVDT